MTVVNINLKNVGSSTSSVDSVTFYSPVYRDGTTTSELVSTAEHNVPLVDGVASVDLIPGPVRVHFRVKGIADTVAKDGTVPDSGPVSLNAVLQDSLKYTPGIINGAIEAVNAALDEAVAQVEAAADDANFARVSQGKNLYDPAADTLGVHVRVDGVLSPLADYRTTDFIPVVAGQSYALSTMRHLGFWDADRVYMPEVWQQTDSSAPPVVVTAPEGAAYMRMSYRETLTSPSTVQIELGDTHTDYEPYGVRHLDPAISIPAVEGLEDAIASRPTIPEVQALVNAGVEDATAGFARVVTSKNLYNLDTDTLGAFLDSAGRETALSGYRISDYITVTPGESYALSVMRHLGFYDADKNFMMPAWTQLNPQAPTVVTVPAGAAYMRMSYRAAGASDAVDPATVQIEHGTTHTTYEPWYRMLDPTISTSVATPTGAVTVNRTGDLLSASSDLGGKNLTQNIGLKNRDNSVFNFTTTTLGGVEVHATGDDVTPLRTQQGTVGANHGFAMVGKWVAGTHDKTLADVGSVWTDGTAEHVILSIDDAGAIYVGKQYATVAGAATPQWVVLADDLTHVSGATNTAPIPKGGQVYGQLYPWVQRRRQVVEMDGRPVEDGYTQGQALTVRESYEILDYGAVYDWAKSHVGQLYSTVTHRASVGVSTEWVFHPGGKTRHHTRIWEVSPTQLGNCGFLQANALTGDVTRYLPGVGVVGGLDWDNGVPLSSLTTNLLVTLGDLLNGHPPTVLVDSRTDVGMAVAISPWFGAGKSADRLASTPANLWDLRNTKKIYPNVTGTTPPGWGSLEVEGIRAFLTPQEAQSIVADADPLSAWVTLDQMAG